MSLNTGLWGYETYGAGYFGYSQSGVRLDFALLSAELLNTLLQASENTQQIAVTCKINGTDISSYVESVNISSNSEWVQASADIVYVGLSSAIKGQSVEIDCTYLLSSGDNFTVPLFRGTVQAAQQLRGALNQTTNIKCHDNVSKFLAQSPDNLTWTGYSTNLIADELSRNPDIGFQILDAGNIYYPLPSAYNTAQYIDKLTLIRQILGARDVAIVGINPGLSTVNIASYVSGFDKTYVTIPQSAITSYQEDVLDGYNAATVQDSAGNVAVAYGNTDSKTVFRELVPIVATLADAQLRANAVIAESAQARRIIQIPLNPLFAVCEKVTCKDINNTDFSGRITAINHYIAWTGNTSPGAWTTITMRLV